MLAQPGSATRTVVTDVKGIAAAAAAAQQQGAKTATPKASGGPVYARLIQPPGTGQIRLATVRTAAPGGGGATVRLASPGGGAGGTVRLASGAQMAGLNVIHAQRVVPPATAQQQQVVTTASGENVKIVMSPAAASQLVTSEDLGGVVTHIEEQLEDAS